MQNVQKLVRDPDSSLKIQFTTGRAYYNTCSAYSARTQHARLQPHVAHTALRSVHVQATDPNDITTALGSRLLWHIFAEADSFVPR